MHFWYVKRGASVLPSNKEAHMPGKLERIVIIGWGPVGSAAGKLLARQGRTVIAAQRSTPADLPPGVAFVRCDVLDAQSVRAATAGATQVVAAFGIVYDGAVWRASWPRAMANLLDACEAENARLVFFDGLYMYGPQRAALTEETPLSNYGRKPAVRSDITRQWMAVRDRVRVAALRAPDFYGPGVTVSHLGDVGFARIAQGNPAFLVAQPDMPHDFAYAPDLGRAVVTMLDAPDEDFGQAWHTPCPPTRTPREILQLGADAIGVKLKVSSLPLALLPVAGMAVPFLREVNEMRFTWDRPYVVDWSKWARRFGPAVTPHEIGAAETARSFLPAQALAA